LRTNLAPATSLLLTVATILGAPVAAGGSVHPGTVPLRTDRRGTGVRPVSRVVGGSVRRMRSADHAECFGDLTKLLVAQPAAEVLADAA